MHAFVARLPQTSQSGSAFAGGRSAAARERAGAEAPAAAGEGGVAARAAAAAEEGGVDEGGEEARRSEVEGVEEGTCSVCGLPPAFFPPLFFVMVLVCVGCMLRISSPCCSRRPLHLVLSTTNVGTTFKMILVSVRCLVRKSSIFFLRVL